MTALARARRQGIRISFFVLVAFVFNFSTWAGIFLVGVGFGWIGLAWLLGRRSSTYLERRLKDEIMTQQESLADRD